MLAWKRLFAEALCTCLVDSPATIDEQFLKYRGGFRRRRAPATAPFSRESNAGRRFACIGVIAVVRENVRSDR